MECKDGLQLYWGRNCTSSPHVHRVEKLCWIWEFMRESTCTIVGAVNIGCHSKTPLRSVRLTERVSEGDENDKRTLS